MAAPRCSYIGLMLTIADKEMPKMNTRAIGKITTAIIVVCLIVVAASAGAVAWNMLKAPVVAAPTAAIREGSLAITVTETEPTTGLANTGAGSSYNLYHLRDPNVWPIGSKSDLSAPTPVSGATSMDIGPADNKQVTGGYRQYLVLQAYSGTADYIAMSYMLGDNPGVVVDHQENIDLGIDGYPEVLFLLDLTGKTLYATQAIATPVPVKMDLTVLDNTLSDNNPADVDVSGTGAQSGSGSIFNWQITITTDNIGDSLVLGRVYLTFNDSAAYLTAKGLTISPFSGPATVITSPTSDSTSSNYYRADYYPMTDVAHYRWTYNGLYMYRSSGSNNYINIGWSYDYSFANSGSGYATTVILYWDVVGSTSNGGTLTSYSDTVIIDNAT